MKMLPLASGAYAKVDDEDFESLSAFKWNWCGQYVQRTHWDKDLKRHCIIRLHRHLLNPPNGLYVDHIDHDLLNNQRSNLRLCTRSQNAKNPGRARPQKTSKFMGVCWDSANRKWMAQIRSKGKTIKLGRFVDELAAARAWNLAALHDDPEFRKLNVT